MISFFKNFFKNNHNNTLKEDNTMKYLIVGLGNIGSEYDETRHNVGFAAVDKLAARFDVSFRNNTHGDLTTFKHKSRTFILLKPSTYMNLSGKAVRYWMQKENIAKENILVVLDDLNLDFGKQRIRGKGSDGGHNGLKSIDQLCGGNDYPRLRIGIGDNFKQGRQVDYVLGKWTNDEMDKLPDILEIATETILNFGVLGIEKSLPPANKDKKS
jgi:PTH1 family peptidyl-tRNA hydrolase